jgi:hypothetical protein
VTELKTRLRAELTDAAEALEAAATYLNELTVSLSVDRVVAEPRQVVEQMVLPGA